MYGKLADLVVVVGLESIKAPVKSIQTTQSVDKGTCYLLNVFGFFFEKKVLEGDTKLWKVAPFLSQLYSCFRANTLQM